MAGVVESPDAALRGELTEPGYLERAKVVLRVEEDEVERFLRNELERADFVNRYRKPLDPCSRLISQRRIDLQRVEMADADESAPHRRRRETPVCAGLENARW